MIDFCVPPFTSKPKAAALCLLITLLSLLLGAAVAEESCTSIVSSRVDQLNNAFKLLQLQLKQTTETAEHVQSLLADLALSQPGTASAYEQAEEAVVSKAQEQKPEQKQEQECEQTPSPTNKARPGISAPSMSLVDKRPFANHY